ncbi:MAG TPA: ABC transporter permease [Draconibacterium sp.]|nr:ABC transporter permease [Draconibacterium sp.]
MFKHYFLIFFRSLKRNKGSFFINLIGLSSGLACALLIYLWVNDELKTDMFHENNETLYQVLTTHPNEDGIDTWRSVPIPLAPALAEEMPEIEYAVSSSPVLPDFVLSNGEQNFDATGIFADGNFFKVFSYDFLEGNRGSVLSAKNSVVITEKMALTLFNTTENVTGKTISWQSNNKKMDVVITGILKDISANSSTQFDFACSYEVFKDMAGTYANWGNHQAKTYLQLKKGTDLAQFRNKIVDFLKTKDKNSNVTILLQKYSDIYLYNNFKNGKLAGGRIEYVRLFSIIAIFILVIACINFMNMSTAKAFRKIKEVGIKKTIGSNRSALIGQYLGESLITSFFAFVLALLIVVWLLPQFNVITGKHLSLVPTGKLIFAGISILILTGLTAGAYPAFYLSGFRPYAVLKGKLYNSAGEFFIRKGLVVFQFALSVILIVSVFVVYRQVKLIQTKDPGYNRENIVQFRLKGKLFENAQSFLSEVRKIPGVKHAATMWGSMVGETGMTQGSFNWEGKDPNAVVSFSHLGIGNDMLELLGVEMKSGRSFSSDFGNEENKIIINEAGIDVMGLTDPVGKTFNLWGSDYEIIGIAKDFNFQSFHENVKPFFFRYRPKEAEKILIKIEPGREKATIENVRKLYESFSPGYVFNYSFLSDEYQRQYLAEQRISVLSKYFAGLAILISCLGLFAMSTFTAERRTKEMGIRKVMGSNEIGIAKLLSGEFSRVVTVAIVIAIPIAYLATHSWLESFAYKTSLSWWIFALAGLITLGITLLTVSFQSWRAATRNPVEALRYE